MKMYAPNATKTPRTLVARAAENAARRKRRRSTNGSGMRRCRARKTAPIASPAANVATGTQPKPCSALRFTP